MAKEQTIATISQRGEVNVKGKVTAISNLARAMPSGSVADRHKLAEFAGGTIGAIDESGPVYDDIECSKRRSGGTWR